MSDTALSALVRRIAHAAAGPGLAGEADTELLRRFAVDQNEAAFAALVARHGPMVLDVCRAVLGHDADAEDAFQATFLVLARNAGAIRRPASLAAWLHGVAYRTARKARVAAARRHTHEARVDARETVAADDLTWAEVRAAVHEALAGLGERYRTVLVLCYLDGCTQEQAAAALGLSAAAVKKRLERGREMLRVALARRGFGPAAVLAVSVLPAVVPPALAESVARLAVPFSAGPVPGVDTIPARVLELVNGGKPMLSVKLASLVLLPALLVGAALAGGAVLPVPELPLPHVGPVPAGGEQIAEEKRLAGAWAVRHIETDGKAIFAPGDLAQARITFDGNVASIAGFRVLFVRDFLLTLNPAGSPKTIDATFLQGPKQGETFQGVYVIRGDEVRICLRLTHPEHGRPKGFVTNSGTTLYTFILAREKKEAQR